MASERVRRRGQLRFLPTGIPTPSRAAEHKYSAFISYNHAADGRLAPALRNGLHRFAKPWYRQRALRVFRDDDSLSVTPGLWPSIETALAGSEFFILLASPQSAASYWVDQEVRYWLAHKPSANLLIVLTDGVVAWDLATGAVDRERTNALPPSLVEALQGKPRYIDLRWAATEEHLSLEHPQFRGNVADLAATLHHKAKDELIGEDVRQHRRTVRLVRATAAVLVGLTLAATGSAAVAVQQRNQAQAESDVALSRQLAAEASASRDSSLVRSLLLSAESVRASDTFESRASLVAGLQTNPHLLTIVHPPAALSALAFQPDGNLLLSSLLDNDLASMTVWDPMGNRLLRQVHTGSLAGSPQISQFLGPAGSTLVAGNAVWDTISGRQLFHVAPSVSQVLAAGFSPDRSLLAVDSASGPLLLDGRTGRELGGFVSDGDASGLRSLAFSRDGEILGGGTVDGTIFLWDVQTRRPIGRPLLIGDAPEVGLAIGGMLFSPDGSVVVAVDYHDGIAGLWNVRTGQRLAQASLPRVVVKSSALSPDGRLLALGTADGSVVLWDMQRLAVVGQVSASAETGQIDALSFGPDGGLLAAGGLRGDVAVWDIRRQQRLGQPIPGHDGAVAAVAFSPDRTILAAASVKGLIRLWNPLSRAAVGPPMVDSGADLTSMAFREDNRLLATGSGDGTVGVWDVRQHRLVVRLTTGRRSRVTAVAFNRDGSVLVAGSADGRLRSWDVASRRWLGPLLNASSGLITSVTFSPDGRLLASAGGDGVIRLWDAQRLITAGRGPTAPGSMVTSLSFSPDGATLVAGGVDGTIGFWDVAHLRKVARLGTGHPVTAVAFDPTGRIVASGGDDGSVTLWDAGRMQQLGSPMTMHGDGVTSLAFEPDGTELASGGADQAVVLWNTDPSSWLHASCAIAGRSLSQAEWDAFVGNDHHYHRTCSQFPPGG
jgi:WD40 repeat protein